jgi:hypothetical protein
MLAQINKSDLEDTASEPEPEVESDSSNIKVVISDNKLEELGDEGSSNVNSFITSSSSNKDKDDDVSKDKEYGSARHNKVSDKEES